MKASIIVSSKVFRKFLKQVQERYIDLPVVDDLTFNIEKGLLSVLSLEIYVEHRGEGKVTVSTDSIDKMVKVLKQAKEQPIKIQFEDSWNSFNLQCIF